MASFREMSLPVQLVVAFVVAALMLGGGYYVLLKPMIDENATAQASLDKQKLQNDGLRVFKAKLPELEANIASLKQQLEIQKKIVPDEKEADQFGVTQLELYYNDQGHVYCLLEGPDEESVRKHHAAIDVPCGQVHQVKTLL